jgi:hypothetical protein
MSRAARRLGALFVAGLVAAGLVVFATSAAHAAPGDPIPAQVRFEIGPFDVAARDWPVAAVELSGGLLEGKRAAVTLEGADGATLWEGETDFTAPVTRLVLDRFVPVGAVERVQLSQQGFPVGVVPVVTEAPAAAIPAAPTPPEVHAEIVTRPTPNVTSPSVHEVVDRGTTSTPRLAVSLIVLLVVFAIVFRLPLVPVGTPSRWQR